MNWVITFLIQVSILLGLLFMSLWFHELGHILYFLKVLNKKVKISIVKVGFLGLAFRVGNQKDYTKLTEQQYASLSGWGVAAGFIPIVLLGSFSKELFTFWFLLYILGCTKDIWNVAQYLKKNEVLLDD